MPTFFKIRNSKSEIRKLPGYTLIEFLVVISILSLSVGSVLMFLTSTLKGANQANVTSEVKQNGQSVLDNLQTQIRSATKAEVFSAPYLTSPAVSGLLLTLSSTEYLNVVCFNATATENGYIGVAKSSTETPVSAVSNYQKITNTDPISGVDVVCTPYNSVVPPPSFQVSGNFNLVIVDFTVNQGVLAPSRVDFKANAKFKTTVGIRSY